MHAIDSWRSKWHEHTLTSQEFTEFSNLFWSVGVYNTVFSFFLTILCFHFSTKSLSDHREYKRALPFEQKKNGMFESQASIFMSCVFIRPLNNTLVDHYFFLLLLLHSQHRCCNLVTFMQRKVHGCQAHVKEKGIL